jgi:hypothetical protein
MAKSDHVHKFSRQSILGLLVEKQWFHTSELNLNTEY